ncbi:MAG: hypothetical protein AAF340_00915 [Pseudomonadota bacterium]
MKRLLLACCLLFGLPASAQDGPPFVLDALSITSLVVPPPWVAEGSVEAQSEVINQQGRAQNGNDFFRWHSIPKGQTFTDWSHLYSVTAERPLTGDLQLYANGAINNLVEGCEGGAVQFSETEQDTTRLFIVFCPQERARPGTGQVAFYNLTMARDTLVKNVLRLRVPHFSLDEGLPSESEATLRQGLRRVASMQLFY